MRSCIWRQLAEAASRASFPCRQSKPAAKRPTGATQRKVASQRVSAALLLLALAGVAQTVQNAVDVKPSPQQVAWQDLEFGVIIHFGPNTFLNQEWGDGSAS